ncbi:MAG: hypothetical protein JNN08_12010, partial [Bryobacterales bacterium]|nr:hypothetical protein [Bryobacterales bacterium]
HTGNFSLGQVNAEWTLTVTNTGPAPTSGEVRVNDYPQGGGGPVPVIYTFQSIGGSGWTCPPNPSAPYCTRTDALAPGASYPPIVVRVSISNTAGVTSVSNVARVSGGGDASAANNESRDTALVDSPDLTISKTHSGSFTQGQIGARYTIVVSNRGTAASSGQVAVDENPPPRAFWQIVLSGAGWSCVGRRCTRTDSLAPGASYPPITVTVNVLPNAPANVTNEATVTAWADRDVTNNTAADPTAILDAAVDLRISKSHSGVFTQGQTNALYTISVTNVGTTATFGPVIVVDNLPPALTAVSMSGVGWACVPGARRCIRSDALPPAASYPPIELRVNVAANAPATVVNTAVVSVAGDVNLANNTAIDATVISPATLNLTVTAGAVIFNRGVNRYQQIVQVRNNGAGLPAAALVLDSLSAGAALVAPDGFTTATAPTGSPYRELGPIPAGGVAMVRLEFVRAGAVPITYIPRVLGPGPR